MDNPQHRHWTDDSELLDRFILDRIDQSERVPLDQHLLECERCRRIVRTESEFVAGIKLSGREKLKEVLRESLKSEEVNIFQRYQFISLAAAVLVILIGLGVFRFYVGSFEWPVKFSSRNYIVKQSVGDSSTTAERKKERSASQEENSEAEDLAAAGAPAHQKTASNNVDDFQNEIGRDRNPKAFWLLGTVIMTPETDGKIHLSSKAENEGTREKRMEKKFLGQSRVFAIQKDGASQTITLRQRSSEFLPSAQAKKGVDDRTIQTLVEKTPQGLNLTLYRDTLFQNSQIQQATIEPVTKDSLIVILANEHIAYRIPGGWSAQQSTKTNFERR
jgi:hypothetical protein